MKRIERLVAEKTRQWSTEALMFNALHGKRGGTFHRERWANGRIMVGPPGCRANQCITEDQFERLRANGWNIHINRECGCGDGIAHYHHGRPCCGGSMCCPKANE